MLFYNILIFYMTILIYKICTNIQTSTSDRMIHSDLFEADLILRRIIAHIRYFFFSGCRDNCLSVLEKHFSEQHRPNRYHLDEEKRGVIVSSRS